MSRLVLTGATGFLGQALVLQLAEAGEIDGAIALTRRPSAELSRKGVDVRVGSLMDPVWVREQLEPGDTIVHMAGQVEFTHASAQAMHDLHVEATRILGRAALQVGASRFVLLSSSGTTAVSRHPVHHDESAPYPFEIVSRWPYYLSKLLQERLVRDLHAREGLPAVILNPSLLLGPGDERGGTTTIVSDFLARRIPFAPQGGISVVDVRDVAAAVRGAIARGRIGERYFLGGLNCPFADFFRKLEACSGVRAPLLTTPKRLGLLGAHAAKQAAARFGTESSDAISPSKIEMANHFWYINWQKAASELGFAPRPAEQTIRETIAFLETRAPAAT
jgi:dihydroflavonol-4-reductase